jgi:hypothetical protein
MHSSANILRFTLSSATDTYCVQGGSHIGRLILRFTADTRLAMFEGYLDSQYIVFPADTIIVLDPPNLLSEEDLWFRLDSATTGIVEVLRC